MTIGAEPVQTLRERKRVRTRALLVETGRRLFEEQGYDTTTVADIAAAADIGTRTFFAYFDSKEQLLFPEVDPRVTAVHEAIEGRSAKDGPAQVLVSALDSPSFSSQAADPAARLRLRLMPEVPAIRARALLIQFGAQEQIAEALCAAFPRLDRVDAAALVGAFLGAVPAVFQALGVADGSAQTADGMAAVRAPVARALGLRD